MKVLILANQKGGVGKTTIATNLAVTAEKAGFGRIALLDFDRQGSLAGWHNRREAETPRMIDVSDPSEMLAKVNQARRSGLVDLLIVDTPATISPAIVEVLKVADLALVPLKPSPYDLEAAAPTIRPLLQHRIPFAYVLTMTKHKARINDKIVATLTRSGPVAGMIGDRIIFPETAINGRTVAEEEAYGESAKEFRALWAWVLERFEMTKDVANG